MAGFYYNDDDQLKNQFKVKDKEGVDFEDQFLSLKNMSMMNEKDNHQNEEIDIRNFYNLDGEEYDKIVNNVFHQKDQEVWNYQS